MQDQVLQVENQNFLQSCKNLPDTYNSHPEVLGEVKPGTHYNLEVHGDVLILRPEDSSVLSHQEKAAQWQKWATSHSSNSPGLPDEALRRENIYD